MPQDGVKVTAPDLAPHHITETVHKILTDISRIVQCELRLARTEVTEKAKAVASGVLVLGVAAVAGLLAAACMVAACIAALAIALPLWLSALVMAVLLGMVTALAYAAGKAKIKQLDVVPERTVDTMRESIQWAKQRTE